MKTTLVLSLVSITCFAQVTIPDGTKVRVALDQTISSAAADEGQTVDLTVTEAIKVDGVVVIGEGARATGTVLLAQQKRRMGRAGKLDFSIDRVRAVDGEWVPVRYTVNKKAGDSKATSTGVMTAGAAIVFWPAAPFFLLRHGKDVQVNKGVVVDVYTDRNHDIAQVPTGKPGAPPAAGSGVPAAIAATVVFESSEPGADVEVDGLFMGSTPATLKIAAGQHSIVIRKGNKSWQRTMLVTAGGTVNVNAVLSGAVASRR